ncbi:MAG TPA: DUF5691 domain-containing protein, partial [Blastocatellia bacterium]|nr:DUF5691 domain-containing protein [Blastocatellia bacterium]
MRILAEIVKAAVIGSERQQPTLTGSGGALGGLIARLDQADREAALLGAAAAAALYERAGRLPARRDRRIWPAPCAEDERARCSPHSAVHLSLLLQGNFQPLLPEWLECLAAAGKRVPEEWLEPLLKLGRTRGDLHSAIRAVIGRRGLWLAAQNPEWDYLVESPDETAWETGEQERRLALFSRMRQQDPARARELLKATWSTEPPKNRADFLERFARGLSLDDEPFLEGALDDRHKEVRRLAARSLARLPDAQLQQRMIARLGPLLTLKPGRLGPDRFEIGWPEACDKSMIRDGIESQPPSSSPSSATGSATEAMGQRAWWLYRMLSVVPPRHWSRSFGRAPAELIKAALNSEGAEIMLSGWCEAAALHADREWAEALIDWSYVDPKPDERRAAFRRSGTAIIPRLLAALDPSRLEEMAERILSISQSPLHDLHPALTLLSACHHEWSERLSRVVIMNIRQRIQIGVRRESNAWTVRHWLKEVGMRLPAELADKVAQGWPQQSGSWPDWEKAVEEMLSIVSFRR